MKNADDMIRKIEQLIGGMLDRPQMYADSPESLETLFHYFDLLRTYAISDEQTDVGAMTGYAQYLVAQGLGSASVSSHLRNCGKSVTFAEIVGSIRAYLQSQYFPAWP